MNETLKAMMEDASDNGVDPGIVLEESLQSPVSAPMVARKVNPPPAKSQNAYVEESPDIQAILDANGIDMKALGDEVDNDALVKHEQSVNDAVADFMKRQEPEFGKEGKAFGQWLNKLISVPDKAKPEGGAMVEATSSTLANLALVPGKWVESATNAVGDVLNYVGRKYNWNGGNDTFGKLEFFKEAQKQLPNGQTAAKIVEYAVPTAALVAGGAAPITAATMGAVINSIVVDPDDQRLADHLDGTFLEKIPLVAEAVDYLQYDPTDSALEKRWKNALESFGVDLGVAKIFGVVRGMRAKGKADIRAINETQDVVEKTIKQEAAKGTEAISVEAKTVPVASAEVPPAPTKSLTAEEKIAANTKALAGNTTDEITGLSEELANLQSLQAKETVPNPATVLARRRTTDKLVKAQESQLEQIARQRMNQNPEIQAAYIERADKVVDDAAENVGVTRPQADEMGAKFDEVFESQKLLTNNAEVVSTVGRLFKTIEETTQSRGPMTLQDMYALGGTIVEDVDFLKTVAGREMGDLMNAEGTVAVKKLASLLWDDFVAKAAKATPDNPTGMAALAESFENMSRMSKIVGGYSEEAGRTLGIHRHLREMLEKGDPVVTALIQNQVRTKIVLERISKTGGLDKIANIAQLIEEADAAVKAAGVTIDATTGVLSTVPRWARLADGIISYINTNRLNSVSLQGRIIMSSAVNTGRRLVNSFNEAIIGKLIGADDVPTLQTIAADINGMAASVADAAASSAEAWRTGTPKGPGALNLDMDQLKVTALPTAGGESIAAKAWNTAGVVLASGRRGIMSIEAGTGMVNYRGKLYGLAERAAGTLEGAERAKFVQDFVTNPPKEAHDAAIAAIEDINLTGKIRTKWIEDYVTLGDAGGNRGKYHPITMLQKLFMPFANTRGRFIEEALDHVPIANLLVKDNLNVLRTGSRAEKAAVMAKMATGVETLGVLGYLIHNGQLTGGPPADYKIAKLLSNSENGWMPYAAKVGDKYVELPFMDDSIKKVIETAAYLTYAAKSPGISEQEYGEALTLAGLSVGNILAPNDNLRFAGDLIGLLREMGDGKGSSGKIKPILGGLATSSVPFAGVGKDYNLAFGDKTVKDYKSAEDMMDYIGMRMRAVIPGLSEDVPPARNIFGEPVLVQTGTPLYGSFLASQDATGDLVTERLRLLAGFYDMLPSDEKRNETVAFTIAEPPRSIKVSGVEVPLTPKEYDEYAYMIGQGVDDNGMNLKDYYAQELTNQNASAVFEHVRNHGRTKEGFEGTDVLAKEYEAVVNAINGAYEQRKGLAAIELSQRPEIIDRANDIIKNRTEAARKGFMPLEQFME